MARNPKVIIYVDDDTMKLDLASIICSNGATLEVRRSVVEGTRHFTDPVVYQFTESGMVTIDTSVEPQ